MAYVKNLGRVKGKKGGYWTPEVNEEYVNDNSVSKYRIKWKFELNNDEDNPDTGTEMFSDELVLPMYVPIYDEDTGDITFTLVDKSNADSTAYPRQIRHHIKGEKGEPGTFKLDFQFVQGYGAFSYDNQAIKSAISSGAFTPNSHTVYVFPRKGTQNDFDYSSVYVYDDTIYTDNAPSAYATNSLKRFIKLEGVDLSGYRTIDDSYSKDEIDLFYDKEKQLLLDAIFECDGTASLQMTSLSELEADELSLLIEDKINEMIQISATDNVNDDDYLCFHLNDKTIKINIGQGTMEESDG